MEKIGDEMSEKGMSGYFSAFLSRIGGVFLAPDAAFKQIIADKVGVWEPFLLILLLVGIEGAVFASFVYRVILAIAESLSYLTGNVPLGLLGAIPWIMVILMAVVALIFWIVVAGIAHISAKYIFKSEGSFVQLLKLYGYSLTPYSLVILGTVLLGISWATWPLSMFFNIVATFWVVLLMAVAVKHNYNIDVGKAFISSFIGPMVVWLIIVGVFWAWLWLIISSFAGGFV
ncbi:MAG: YIP1 family protein [Candidatus Bathyarchaeota archaeon]|nr:YIP1 family protein [Candidatus Bathyarchaeota archaeon]